MNAGGVSSTTRAAPLSNQAAINNSPFRLTRVLPWPATMREGGGRV
jgi:hypothetical protein